MSATESVTIDNLPIEASVEWAIAQETVETKYVKESPYISGKTEMLVNAPTVASLDQLFETHKKAPTWAFFIEPPQFFAQTNRFFRGSIIPDQNSEEMLDKLEELSEDIKKASLVKDHKNLESLKNLLKASDLLDKMLHEIRSKILQFRKG